MTAVEAQPAPASRATASRRSSTRPSTCSPRSATTGSPWTPSPRGQGSKATLYRRWNSKVSLVIEALLSQKGPDAAADTGTLRGDLLGAFCGMGGLTDERQMAVLGAVITAIARDAEFAEACRDRVHRPQDRDRPDASSTRARSAARSATTSTSTCSRRACRASSCTACSSSASRPPRT